MLLNVAVIIPFYQRTPGILRHTLRSVLSQQLPPDLAITLFIIDDGSPVPATSELEGLPFPDRILPRIIQQPNLGVSQARNTGLASVDDTFKYVAFLDSDDRWDTEHVSQGIAALESGSDFHFCDHSRDGHHPSHFAGCEALRTLALAGNQAVNMDCVHRLTNDEAETVILRDFVCQASTTIFRRSIAPTLRFHPELRSAGEDMLFFLCLAARAKTISLSTAPTVHCGSGVNIYYANLNWDAAGFLKRLVERRQSHIIIQRDVSLSRNNSTWNAALIRRLEMDIAFHSIRHFVRAKGKWPPELRALATVDPHFMRWFGIAVLRVTARVPLRRYTPA
jgi:succinoglycan biosynthesis protein ExoW